MRVLESLAILILAGGVWGALAPDALAQPAAAQPVSAEEAAFTAKINKLWEQYNANYAGAKIADADKVVGEILALARGRYGNHHDSVAFALDSQAQVKAYLGDAVASKSAAEAQIAVVTALYGA